MSLKLSVSYKAFATLAGILTILIGGIVLIGWTFNIAFLKSIGPNWASMKVNTGLAFVLLGLSLWCLATSERLARRWARPLAYACASLVALIGVLTLVEYGLNRDLGIDQLLFKESIDTPGIVAPGRMGPNTAFNFIILSLALLTLDRELRGYRPAQFMALTAALVALFSLAGYLYGVKLFFYGFGNFTQMALHTATLFLVLSLGVLSARPEHGLMWPLSNETTGGALARRLLPWAVVIPAVVAWLVLQGERAGLYPVEFGESLLLALIITLSGIIIWGTAGPLSRADLVRQRTEATQQQTNDELSQTNAALIDQTAELARTNRVLRTLSDCNQVLVRAESEADLLHHICRVIVETGGYPMAWVGYAEQDQTQTVRPMAQAGLSGTDRNFLDLTNISWGDTEHGSTPIGIAIRTGKPAVVQIASGALDEAWRAEALERGYVAYMAFPLLAEGRAFGGLGIFASEPEAFDATDVKMLSELTDDLAYGLMAQRTRAAHQQAEAALRESQAQMAGVIGSAMDAIITVDDAQRITVFNAAAEKLFKISSAEAYGQPLARFIPERFRAIHHDHVRRFSETNFTIRQKRALNGLIALRADGTEFPMEASISQIEISGKKIFTVILRDITERQHLTEQIQQSADRAEALAELSRALSAARLDYQAVLDLTARRMTELIGDACNIRVLSDDGQWLEVASLYHPNAETMAFLREILAARSQRADEGLGGQVMRTGQPALFPVIAPEQLKAMVPATAWPILERNSIYSLMTVPLRAQGQVLGTLTMSRDKPDQPFTTTDVAFVQDLADRAALAIANAHLYLEIQQLNADLEQRVHERTEQLRESEEKFSKVFLASPAAVSIASLPDGRYINVNEAFIQLTGYSNEELIAHTSAELGLVDSTARAKILEAIRQQGHARNVEIRVQNKSKQPMEVLTSIEQIELGGRLCTISVNYDITQRKRAEAEIQRLNDDLAVQAAQLQVANRELQHAKGEADQARSAAEAANRAKSEFLSRMSHELRTPLNAILGFAQILEMAGLSPDHQEGIKHILASGRHLLSLINEVLDIARIETGRMSFSPEPVPVNEVIREAADLIQPMADQKSIQLQLVEISDQYVRADHQRLKQVLLNLFSNAVKYNRPGGQVRATTTVLSATQSGGTLRLEVTDTGHGIPAHKMTRLFTPFDRLDAEETDIPGTGLGLALSKSLVEAMGGVMGAESMVGQGTTFWLEMPLVEAPKERLKRTGSLSLLPASSLTKIKTVLYVEDNLSNQRLVEQILAYRPTLRLMTAIQGRLGIELAHEHQPALILLDLNLPDLHGSQVLSLLRADPRTQSIPVVVISADATLKQIERLLESGAKAYLTKPFDVKQFLQVVDEALA